MKIENEVLIWKRLGRRVTEQLEVLRKRYLSAAEQFQSLTRYPKEAVLIGSILVLTGAIFAFAGSHESAEPKVWNTDETEFKRDRILGDPYAVTVKAKEDLLGKVTKDYQSSQKDVLEGLSAVKTRLEALEAKAVGLQPGQGMTEPKELLEEPSSPMPGGIGISDEADPVPLAQQGSAPGGESHVGRNAPQEPRPRRLRAAHLAARLPLTPPWAQKS